MYQSRHTITNIHQITCDGQTASWRRESRKHRSKRTRVKKKEEKKKGKKAVWSIPPPRRKTKGQEREQTRSRRPGAIVNADAILGIILRHQQRPQARKEKKKKKKKRLHRIQPLCPNPSPPPPNPDSPAEQPTSPYQSGHTSPCPYQPHDSDPKTGHTTAQSSPGWISTAAPAPRVPCWRPFRDVWRRGSRRGC